VRAAAPGGGDPDGGDPDAAVGREQLGARTRFVASVAAPPGGAADGAERAATARATTACNVGKGSKDSGGSPRCGGGRADDAGERVPGRLGEILWEGEPSGAQPKGSGELVLWNRGTLGREVLALGNTTKHGGLRAFAGGHGEGLKVGALALVRAGHAVVLQTAAESWRFRLADGHLEVVSSPGAINHDCDCGDHCRCTCSCDSATLAQPASMNGAGDGCTCFCDAPPHCHCSAPAGIVRVTVSGVGPAVFREADFLFLAPRDPAAAFVGRGSRAGQLTGAPAERLLLGVQHAGRVYSRGILVEERRELVHGVDLDLALTRDRTAAASRHALRTSVGYLWADAVVDEARGPALLARFVSALQDTPQSLEAELPSRFWLPMLEQFPCPRPPGAVKRL
jgi:hypothetical protein